MSENTTSDENKNQLEVIMIVIPAIATVFLIAIVSLVAVYLVRRAQRRSDAEAMYMNANSIDDPIELFEQLEENNEGEALIENTIHASASSDISNTIHASDSGRGGRTQQSDHKRQDKKEEKLIDLPMDLIKEIYGVHVLILVNGRNTDLDENIVKKAAMKELKIAVDMENSFQKWTYNKTEGNYVFRDWIPSDGEYNETDLRKTQLEILQAIKRNRTKFVLVFPLNVWSQNTKLNNMGRWNICRQKTITHSAP